MTFQLVRTTPAGVERKQGPVRKARDAAALAARVLCDNAGVPKADAQRFSGDLHRAALGETVTHQATGYRFRIETSPPPPHPEYT